MNIELKFLFIAKFFILLFVVINLAFIIPFNIFDTSYYQTVSSVILDTSTLLILGFGSSKYVFLKQLNRLEEKFGDNEDYKNSIAAYERKISYNSKISYILSISFLTIALIQPINLIFTLNRNEIYSSFMLDSYNNQLKLEREKFQEQFESNKVDLSNEAIAFEKDEKFKLLNNIAKNNIDKFLEQNNKNVFAKIKINIRNIIMALIWALIFYKLSVI